MKSAIQVKVARSPYPVFIRPGLKGKVVRFITTEHIGNYAVVVTQRKIVSLHTVKVKRMFKGLGHTFVYVPDSEQAKSQEWTFRIIKKLLEVTRADIKRKPVVVCLGGGVVGDLGGFAASVYKRGIPVIQVPTTLLAQVDASIGGKTAINIPQAKNMVGTFYQPRAVFIDPEFLATLKEREMKQGLAEVIKYAAIRDAKLFAILEERLKQIKRRDQRILREIVARCAAIKARIVAFDEKETRGVRTILNFGHTVGHALEAASSYRRGLRHGEAVAIGMVAAAEISQSLGLCSDATVRRLTALIAAYALPVGCSFDPAAVLRSLMYDKKFISGGIRMVLLERIGKTRVCSGIEMRLVKKSLMKVEQSN